MIHGTELSRRLERRVKRWVFGLLAGAPPVERTAPDAVDLASVRRVLVVRTNFRLGNLLLVTPALTALRQALPGARIDVLCAAHYEGLLRHNPDVDGSVTMDRRLLRDPRAFVRLISRLRAAQYDLVVDCARGASFLGAFFTAASRGRWRVATAGSRYQRCFNVHVPRATGITHKVDLLLEFLAGLGIAPAGRDATLAFSDAERARARALWHTLELPPERAPVGVFIGGRGRKRWDIGQLARVIAGLQADPRCTVVLFAGPEDAKQLRTLRHSLPEATAVAPQMPIRDFAAVLQHCAVFVSGDSGPMHLAAAVGLPTVGVFHGPNALSYAPRGPMHRVVYHDVENLVAATLAAVRSILDMRCSVEDGALATATG